MEHCARCEEELEIICEGALATCKNCKTVLAKDDDNHYAEMVFTTGKPVFWINGQLSSRCPVIFASVLGIANTKHYIAGPSMTTIKKAVLAVNQMTRSLQEATLTIIDETKMEELNPKSFNQAKSVVQEHQCTHYLGTDSELSH